MKPMLFVALLSLAFFTANARAEGAAASEGLSESLQHVHLSRGGDLNVLVSKRTGTNPDIAVLLFPGYPGILKLREEAGAVSFDLAGNFIIRARRFLNTEKVFTVAVDCPVDQWSDCGDGYRSSSQHVADIEDVINAIKTSVGAKHVYLLGTSYGTVSTSFLALGLGNKIDGAIHTSTFTDPQAARKIHGAPMSSFDWSKATAPQLFVHHKEDPCQLTRYDHLAARKGDIPLITVVGTNNPRGDACQALTAHGFVGREKVTMTAIYDWITDRKVPVVIGDSE